MSPEACGARDQNISFIARQPILDRHRDVYGYELLFRSGPENYFASLDGDQASSTVISSSMSVHGLVELCGGRKTFINVTRRILLDESYAVLPPTQTVLELLETIEPDEPVVRACRAARDAGYMLALDDFVIDSKVDETLLPEIDILKVDFAASTPKQRRDFAARCQSYDFALLGEKVETHEEFDEAVDLGYSRFQGYFFCKPQMVSTKQIPASELNYLRLLEQINQPEPDRAQLEQTIRLDVSLAYRLLKFLNSVALGVRHEVSSIKHAMSLLGDRLFRKWAALTVLCRLGVDKPDELIVTGLIRAHFCELIGRESDLCRSKQSLFLVGLFSILDAVMDRPMPEILAEISIEPEARGTLLGDQTTLSPVYEMILALERGRWDRVAGFAHHLQVSDSRIIDVYRDSIASAHRLFQPAS